MTDAWMVAVGVLAALVFLLGMLELGTLRRVSPLLEYAETLMAEQLSPRGLDAGSVVPWFAADLANGELVTPAELIGEPFIVLFVGGDCAPCDSLLQDLGSAPIGVRLVVIVNDFAEADSLGGDGVVVAMQRERNVARAFQTNAAPHAFLVAADGRVLVRRVVNSGRDLSRLVERVLPMGADTAGDVSFRAARN